MEDIGILEKIILKMMYTKMNWQIEKATD